jgi:purine nucleosidase
MPLDVTHKALVTHDRLREISAIGSPVAKAVTGWTGFFERFDREKYGSAGAPLHDPTVIAYLIDPGLFSGRHVNVEVEVKSDLTRGMTVADWWGVSNRAPNAQFVGDLDQDGFFSLLTERLARL